MTRAAVLLLAAGASARMRGADKLLEDVDGLPVLRRQAKAALGTGAHVIVALAPNRPERAGALEGLPVQSVVVKNAAEGMGASIRTAVAALSPEIRSIAVLPADMPEITASDLGMVLAASAAHPSRIVRAMSSSGAPGHPVVFPSRFIPELSRLAGDEGARAIIQGEDIHPVPLPAQHALTDLDTPEEWESWRAGRQSQEIFYGQ